MASNRSSLDPTYPIVTFAIKELCDRHSYFKPINELENSDEGQSLPEIIDEVDYFRHWLH